MKNLLSIFFLILPFQFLTAQVPASFFTKTNQFLKENVYGGKVNYKNVKANPGELDAILDIAAAAIPSKSKASEFQAFYINVYNLIVIKEVSKKYPVRSPLSIPGLFKATKTKIAGKKVTLDAIENKILRAFYPKEARFHFALVCAGLGCPPIIPEAYIPNKLEAQLQLQTEKAINNPNFIKVTDKKVKISKIFEWYAKDFKQFGSYVDFLNKYRTTPIDSKAKVSFYEYDWQLNDLK